MKSAGKARSNGLYRHIRTSKEIIRNLLNDYLKNSTTKRRIKIGKTETVIEKINALNIKKRGCVACFLYKSHIYLSSKKAWLLD